MTDKEIIEVVQAHSEGKLIQYWSKSLKKWLDCKDGGPIWDFSSFDYRVKSESKVRPYKDIYECWMDMRKHEPFGWLFGTKDHRYYQIINIDGNTNWEYWLDNYTYVDGSPFGIVEEE